MPFLQTIVSVSLDDQKRANLSTAYRMICREELGKPEDFVMTAFSDNTPMSFQGSTAPAAYVRVECWGEYAPSKPKMMTPRISAAITKECGIPAERIYVFYYSTKHCGWNGANF
ncbi:macrophage migration inhibitory factor-like protein [Leishmania infantum JPCM5]|uniref:L-dopachrome isomerase n=3 Tax=Leishmania donovani species complex TaxID=38574 RepID=A4I971_LEIIN|nr:macrophage migration inhibitory factor-like protein [Leishmania infantum JPCM5]XP_003864011.1 macrophage migration inhibitory factor-like protein [Leishmania donovani]CAC9532552.1 macrophage_migration_inhibitory_factor-like_protein [Leishmania infantum]AYU82164.1 macrophage migration inhibitory factor-like protein [Leishmania donovani]TPP53691.1 Macrophage migration inhibitory factor (MIF) family protein [Leishmania donovani]CAM71373.1 macrophage migration inhibitory factor-like protein [Le|eukprot:XP_001468290.1 macrophage migration inhibitory factor-like protein [Leishmania infantum JPCM5]